MFGAIAVYVNRERHRELIPYVVAVIAVVEMFFIFLMVVHNNPFSTYLTRAPADGRGLNPLLQNFYMAIHPPSLYIGFVGDDDPVRVRHRGADHRSSRRLVAARRAALDDGRLAVPVVRPDARHAVGVRGARAGAATGAGIRSRTPACCRGSPRRRSCTRDGAGAARHAARLERHAGHPHVLPDDLRHVHDAVGRRAVGARVRRGPRAGAGCSRSS